MALLLQLRLPRRTAKAPSQLRGGSVMMQFRNSLLATSAVLVAALGTTAHAQTTGSTAAASSNTIEELVVTAEKRQQNLQDVPVAVSAFTSEKRDLIGVNTIADMTNFTPGLEYNAQNDRNTLRGVGRNTNVHAAQGSVAQYSDGIYTSSTVEAGKTPLFVDRVEVLRGPQGTLYGRNSIGGAINIISKRPTDDPYAEVRAQYQNYNHFILEGAASGPTTIPGIDFRIGANWEKQTDGWYKNTVPGMPQEGNVIDTKYAEGQLKFKFNDNFDGWVKLAWADWHNGGGGPGSRNSYSPAPYPNFEVANPPQVMNPGYACLPTSGVTNVVTAGGISLAQACTNPSSSDPRKFASDVPYQVKLTGTMIFASEFTYHFDNMDLKYIGGGTHYHYFLTGPQPVETAPITQYTLPRVLPPGTLGPGQTSTLVIPGGGPTVNPRMAFNYQERENWISHEINLASTDKGPFQWIAGLYYYSEQYDQPVYTTLQDQPSLGVNISSLAGACAFTGGSCPALPGNNRIYDDRPHMDITSKAAFGQIDWQFTPQWKTTLGLRYTRDDMKGLESLRVLCEDAAACGVSPELLGSNFVLDLTQVPSVVSGLIPGGPGALGTPGVSSNTTVDPATGFATRHYKDHWSATTGTFGLQWDPAEGTMAYFRYSRGYKAGGFRVGIDTTIGASPETQPEHMDAFELGLKKNFGRTLQTNIAIFRYNYKNDQVPISVIPTSGGPALAQSIFFNVPEAISQGFELESTWQPIDHLQVLFNYSYLDAHITKGSGVVDPADPTGVAAGAKPIGALTACPTLTSTGCDAFTGNVQRGQDLSGGNLPNSPKNKVAVNVNYTVPFEPGSLIGSLSYVWRDKQYGSIFNRSYYQAPSYDQWDARLTWKDKDNKYTVIAFVKNIFNDLGYEGGAAATRQAGFVPGYALGLPLSNPASAVSIPVNSGVASTYLLTPPRTYGIELQYRFF
jgi:iron complex outermembrane receptor protein